MSQDVKKIKKIKKLPSKIMQKKIKKQPQIQQLQRTFQLIKESNKKINDQLSICHWNINGLRAIHKKQDFQQFLKSNEFDIICLSETKINHCTLQDSGLHESKLFQSYSQFWSFSTIRKGYSGCVIFSKINPISVHYGMDSDKFDKEGRIVALEYEKFYVVNVYVPNSKQDLSRLKERTEEFDLLFRKYLEKLKQKKAVVILGDFNVAKDDIDVYNSIGKDLNNGFTIQEKESFKKTLQAGFVDIWRQRNENKQQYSWWDYRFQMRKRNLGWRIDYMLIDIDNQHSIKKVEIEDKIKGSDHCPITGIIDLKKIINIKK